MSCSIGTAITLSEFEGLRQKEVAMTLGLSVSGAKSRIQRGRKMLKELLLECCHFELDSRGRIMDYEADTDCHDCGTDNGLKTF